MQWGKERTVREVAQMPLNRMFPLSGKYHRVRASYKHQDSDGTASIQAEVTPLFHCAVIGSDHGHWSDTLRAKQALTQYRLSYNRRTPVRIPGSEAKSYSFRPDFGTPSVQ